MYLASIQAKQNRHNTAVSTLTNVSERLATWCKNNPPIESDDIDPEDIPLDANGWSSFVYNRDAMKLYHCTPSHLAAVCQYNLGVEHVACGQLEAALLGGRRAVALALNGLHRSVSINVYVSVSVCVSVPVSCPYAAAGKDTYMPCLLTAGICVYLACGYMCV